MKDRSSELLFPPGNIRDLEPLICGRIRDVIVEILDEERGSALDAASHEWVADR